jgi:hypothetical protein
MEACKAVDEKTGAVLRVFYEDNMADGPRDWDNLGTMACWHRSYNLGDENNWRDPEEFEMWWQDEGEPEGGIRLPLYLMDHSGISMRATDFGDPWDSGQVGWIYVTRMKLQSEYRDGVPDADTIKQYLKGEVETYDQYLRGDVYGFVLEDADGETIDSVWGFYGDDFVNNGMVDHLPAEYEHLIGELG